MSLLVPHLVRRMALSTGNGPSAVAMELGDGALDGVTVVVREGAKGVVVELGAGARGDGVERLAERLRARGLDVRT